MFARKKFGQAENVDPLQRAVKSKKNVPTLVELPSKAGIPKLKRQATGLAKRSAFGDLTNATKEKEAETKKAQGLVKPALKANISAVPVKKTVKKKASGLKSSQESNSSSVSSSQESVKGDSSLIQKNLAAGVPLDRQEEDFSFIVAEDFDSHDEDDKERLFTIDRENYSDVFNIGIYAQDIFDYYKRREMSFVLPDYLKVKGSKITPMMRSVLIDWMVEIQENFELNHETLYLAVKLSDLFLARQPQDKEQLQLVGAAAVFIASKFDERCPPLIEDFLYICDNSFDRDQFIQMEMEILRKIDFDLGIPLSYRFLRRYSKVAKTSMITLTLSRYILELSLMEYSMVTKRDSLIAAAALYIAMKMKGEGEWEGEVVQSSGYSVEDMKSMVLALNQMLHSKHHPQLNTIHSKYSHPVFHSVAELKPLSSSKLL